MNQYVSFLRNIEKGKFKWGSKSNLRTFEQQLVHNISVGTRKNYLKLKSRHKFESEKTKFEERKKYCLDYNKGMCKLQLPHEGFLNGIQVLKFHICKRCLIDEDLRNALRSDLVWEMTSTLTGCSF